MGKGDAKKADRGCLSESNFSEIKNLVAYVTTTLVPEINRLRKDVETLKRGRSVEPPTFFLGVGGEDSEDETDDEHETVIKNLKSRGKKRKLSDFEIALEQLRNRGEDV